MKRIMTFLLLFVVLYATDSHAQTRVQQIVRTDTILRRDTIITTEVLKRTEVINRIEEVVLIDTVYASDGSKRVVRRTPVSNPTLAIPDLADIPVDKEGIHVSGEHHDMPLSDKVAGNVAEQVADVFQQRNPVEGGEYVWIPDSMATAVDQLLTGHYKPVSQNKDIDPKEKVLFRGDTISMVLRDRNLGRYNRGLFNYLYIPKGIWQLGITASYGEFSTEDLEMFDLISDVDFHGKTFSVRPYFSYFLNNNMSLGMRLGYSYGRANVDSFNVDIDDDMNFNLHDIMYRSETYTAAFTFNQYFGIARRGRFAIFNEVELAFSGGTTDFIRPYNNKLKSTHTSTMKAALNFSPGLSVFIIEPLTFNISFGVFGFYLKNEKQTVDGEALGSRFTSGANFRFNIFNINFGIAVNI